MRQYDIVITGRPKIDFDPESEQAEIIQNLHAIIGTPKSSVPLFRDFGLDADAVDMPINSAKAKIQSDLIMAVRRYEPRAQVTHVEFVPDDNGKLSVKVRVMI